MLVRRALLVIIATSTTTTTTTKQTKNTSGVRTAIYRTAPPGRIDITTYTKTNRPTDCACNTFKESLHTHNSCCPNAKTSIKRFQETNTTTATSDAPPPPSPPVPLLHTPYHTCIGTERATALGSPFSANASTAGPPPPPTFRPRSLAACLGTAAPRSQKYAERLS